MPSTINLDNVANPSPLAKIAQIFESINKGLGFLAPVVDLIVRLWVAWAFFKSGLTKIQTFESTLLLFQYEYEVPLLSPTVAAYLGTAAEVGLPIFVALGLAGRYAALALFLFNIVAVLSYPPVQEGAGFFQHQAWGLLLLVTVVHGPGKLSLDYLIERFIRK